MSAINEDSGRSLVEAELLPALTLIQLQPQKTLSFYSLCLLCNLQLPLESEALKLTIRLSQNLSLKEFGHQLRIGILQLIAA